MEPRSSARLFRLRALQKASASWSALLTWSPVASRCWVWPISEVVFCSDSRFVRVAEESAISLAMIKNPFWTYRHEHSAIGRHGRTCAKRTAAREQRCSPRRVVSGNGKQKINGAGKEG